MPVINQSNSSGTIEFSIPGHEDDFFPVTVSFICKKSFFDISVSTIEIWRLSPCCFNFICDWSETNRRSLFMMLCCIKLVGYTRSRVRTSIFKYGDFQAYGQQHLMKSRKQFWNKFMSRAWKVFTIESQITGSYRCSHLLLQLRI